MEKVDIATVDWSIVTPGMPEATPTTNGLMSMSDKLMQTYTLSYKTAIHYVRVAYLQPNSFNAIELLLIKNSYPGLRRCVVSCSRHNTASDNAMRAKICETVGNLNVYVNEADFSIYCKVDAYEQISARILQSAKYNPLIMKSFNELPDGCTLLE